MTKEEKTEGKRLFLDALKDVASKLIASILVFFAVKYAFGYDQVNIVKIFALIVALDVLYYAVTNSNHRILLMKIDDENKSKELKEKVEISIVEDEK